MKPTIENITNLQNELSQLRWNYWKDQVVFTPQWWFILVSLLLLFCFWLLVLDRKRILQILLFGFISISIVMISDTLGAELQLWEYPKMVLPWGPRVICIDIMIAIFYMLLYQFFPKWKSFSIAAIVLSAVFAFIFEPITMVLGIYKPIQWSPIKSFPIYILLLYLIKRIVDQFVKIDYIRNSKQ